ncbi:hypothetical protein [Helicobacter salomonis]|uniref:hypothetical protein n=1 Tax=Helicobacter salomonis TaxID=56878 RepID=UPI000CF1011C|nr:hypothetical protein [Helicobacter salomonis]
MNTLEAVLWGVLLCTGVLWLGVLAMVLRTSGRGDFRALQWMAFWGFYAQVLCASCGIVIDLCCMFFGHAYPKLWPFMELLGLLGVGMIGCWLFWHGRVERD